MKSTLHLQDPLAQGKSGLHLDTPAVKMNLRSPGRVRPANLQVLGPMTLEPCLQWTMIICLEWATPDIAEETVPNYLLRVHPDDAQGTICT